MTVAELIIILQTHDQLLPVIYNHDLGADLFRSENLKEGYYCPKNHSRNAIDVEDIRWIKDESKHLYVKGVVIG